MKKMIILLSFVCFLEARNEVQKLFEESILKETKEGLCKKPMLTKCFKVNNSQCESVYKPALKKCYEERKDKINENMTFKQIKQLSVEIGRCAGEIYFESFDKKQINNACIIYERLKGK